MICRVLHISKVNNMQILTVSILAITMELIAFDFPMDLMDEYLIVDVESRNGKFVAKSFTRLFA